MKIISNKYSIFLFVILLVGKQSQSQNVLPNSDEFVYSGMCQEFPMFLGFSNDSNFVITISDQKNLTWFVYTGKVELQGKNINLTFVDIDPSNPLKVSKQQIVKLKISKDKEVLSSKDKSNILCMPLTKKNWGIENKP